MSYKFLESDLTLLSQRGQRNPDTIGFPATYRFLSHLKSPVPLEVDERHTRMYAAIIIDIY